MSFCRFRWFWHFYGAGLVVHTTLLIVTVYSVFIVDKFTAELSLILSYVRTPSSDEGKDKIKHIAAYFRVFSAGLKILIFYLFGSSYGHDVFL